MSGLRRCGVCLAHVKRMDHDGVCPSCGGELREDVARVTLGGEVSRVLRSGRSAALATALGVTMTMGAAGCGLVNGPVAVYGGPPIEEDMTGDMEGDMGDEADSEPGADMSQPPAPLYGGPPVGDD